MAVAGPAADDPAVDAGAGVPQMPPARAETRQEGGAATIHRARGDLTAKGLRGSRVPFAVVLPAIADFEAFPDYCAGHRFQGACQETGDGRGDTRE